MWFSANTSKTSQTSLLNTSQSFFDEIRQKIILEELSVDKDEVSMYYFIGGSRYSWVG